MKLTFGDKAFISVSLFFGICLLWLRFFGKESLWICALIAAPAAIAFVKLLSKL